MLSGISWFFRSRCLGYQFALPLPLSFQLLSFMNLHTITFIKAHDRIFRVGSKVEIAGVATNYAVSPLALADGIDEEIPEVENACRIMYTGRPVFTIEDKVFTSAVTLAASSDFIKCI